MNDKDTQKVVLAATTKLKKHLQSNGNYQLAELMGEIQNYISDLERYYFDSQDGIDEG
ncbi:hypothetical protein [Floricoccus penangensis]|uniref:hypothetical protein n=1 Tax=Floricoccus penangensis TaxID=1859475 RepID=UPI002041616E|nr:hypothetical protein [Floricoccus penangensis]URZ87213.1 hypothetical protein KIW23_09035 [Floricoccus penangensis]